MRGCGTNEDKRCEIGRMFERRKLDVLALNETKMKGKGDVMFGRVRGRISGVEGGRGREGVALLVNEELRQCVKEWKEVSSRLMWVKVKVGCETWVFVSAYGPGSERTDEERERFYRDLNACVEKMGRVGYVVVLGDLNARVGDIPVPGVIGSYGVPGRNESGECLLEMCVERELVIGNTWFSKKDIHKYTWVRVANGRIIERALMDYVLVHKSVSERMLDVNVLRGESGGISDHYLVEGRLRVGGRWRKRRRVEGKQVLKVSVLNDSVRKREYQEKLQEIWDVVKEKPVEGVEEEWKCFKEGVLGCAREVCGMRKLCGQLRKGSEWWNEEVSVAVKDKRKIFEEWLQKGSAELYERYKRKRVEVKRKVRTAKRRADEKWGRSLTENFERDKKKFWKEVKRVRGGESGREERVKDVDGNLLVEGEQVRERWAQYFRELLNVEDDREAVIVAVGNNRRVTRMEEENNRSIAEGEVQSALGKMKAGKSPGVDGVNPECLAKGGRVIVEWLVRLFNVCFMRGVVPLDWRSAVVVPLYKGKGDKYECSNFRGISLLSVVGKVYGRVLIERVQLGTEGMVGEEQGGFKRGRGCVDQVFVVRQVGEKHLAKGKDVFSAYMDLEKAYDNVDREGLWQVLRLYGIGGRLLNAVKSFYVESRACVRVGNSESDWFDVKVGLRQGCVMSPWLFNMYIDGVMREMNARVGEVGVEMVGGNGEEWKLNQLLFADDTALVAESEEALQRLVGEFDRVCSRRKLRVNVGKSKVMRTTRSGEGAGMNVSLGGRQLEEVESFKYLGSHIARDGTIAEEVKYRVKEASKCMGGLKSVMSNRTLGMAAKRRLYEGVVVPTAVYGAETWNMKEPDRKRLDVFEMRCLRSMAGVTRLDRLRNEEVRRRTGVERKLSERVDQKVLGWYGHMVRMSDERLTYKVWKAETNGVRLRGRPQRAWMDGVVRALGARGISVEQGRESARDRREWREIVDG